MFTAKDIQGMEQLRRALQIYANTLPLSQAREVATVFPQWAPGVQYKGEMYVSYKADSNGDPILYRTTQAHTSAAEWPPDTTDTLYIPVSLDADGYPVWAQPTGAHDAYNNGDIVSHKDKLWHSRRDGNTSEPGTDEWWELYEYV